MQYLYIGIITILFLSLEKKWITIGLNLQKIKNKYYIISFFGINIVLISLLMWIHTTLIYIFVVTLLLLQGFIILCKVQATKFKNQQKQNSSKVKKHIKNEKLEKKKTWNWNQFKQNYWKPMFSLVILYLYLLFQNQVHLSKTSINIVTNTLLQYGMQIILMLSFTITILKVFLKFKLTKKSYNIMYIMYSLFILSFVFDTLLALLFSQNATKTLNIFSNADVLTTIMVFIGICNSICMYSLLCFDFVLWKKISRGN